MPRFRFSVRWMMVAVVVFALASLGGREAWSWWLQRGYRSPFGVTQIFVKGGFPIERVLVPGRPIPVDVTYNISLGAFKPKPGTTCVLLARVWFEDQQTGYAVDGYTFDVPLTVGGRESASGTFTYDACLPRPGRYQLRHLVYDTTPWGELKMLNGGSMSYEFVLVPLSEKTGVNP